MNLTAEELQSRYGEVLSQPPLCACASPRYLFQALTGMSPPVRVTEGTVKQWWKKYKVSTELSCTSAQQLEDEHGASIRHLATEYPTAYKLCKALRERESPLYISDGVAKQWLQRFGGQADLRYVQNAGHLEAQWGQSIRDHVAHVANVSSEGIVQWLFKEHKVSVPQRICQTWLQRDWSSSGALYSREAVEEALGDRLRLNQYWECFAQDDSV